MDLRELWLLTFYGANTANIVIIVIIVKKKTSHVVKQGLLPKISKCHILGPPLLCTVN